MENTLTRAIDLPERCGRTGVPEMPVCLARRLQTFTQHPTPSRVGALKTKTQRKIAQTLHTPQAENYFTFRVKVCVRERIFPSCWKERAVCTRPRNRRGTGAD